jgi:Cu+-exporting ATPase
MTGATETIFEIKGMNCASCVSHVEKAVRSVNGVASVRVSLATEQAVVNLEPGEATEKNIIAAVANAGYSASVASHHEHQPAEDSSNVWLRRTIAGMLLWLPIEITHWIMRLAGIHAHWMDWTALATSTAALIYVGRGFYQSAWRALKHGNANMDTLIALGATVAWGYSLIAWFGHVFGFWSMPAALYFMESSGLLALISLGHWLEARARRTAGEAIRQLMTLAPATALKLDENGQPVETPLSQIDVGDQLLVLPGQRVPLDGIVQSGQSAVDESMMTGEPIPQLRKAGDSVVGGTINVDGRLTITASHVGSETALAQIVKLVGNAQSSKPPVQQLADRISAIFVPSVLAVALLTAILWWAWGATHGWDGARIAATIANAACSVLIIACPCALGLALPAALMVGTGIGARRGILIRDVDALQSAEKIQLVVLDKTGTVTAGKPVVDRIEPLDGLTAERILQLAACAEQFSAHPLATSVVAEARSRGLAFAEPTSFTSEAGMGIVAEVDGQRLLVGNAALMKKYGAPADEATGTAIHIAQGNNGQMRRLGTILFSDHLKPDSADAVARLHRMNLRTVLLSGDAPAAVEASAKALGIGQFYGGVQPGEKARIIRQLQEHSRVAMVGDGINDAPALATADLGIAIGSGSDVAKETGDIVLVGSGVGGVASAIALSRAIMRTIRQNLFLAFIYNVVAIPLAAAGLLNPLIAAAAMALSDVTVIGNALRLRTHKSLSE